MVVGAELGRPIEILLVEDNPADVRLTEEALSEGNIFNRLEVAGDGEEALAILRKTGDHENATRPDLILLDLNLPKKDGRECLAEIKADPELIRIPVVVLTTSRAESDIQRSYELHANCYITKPVDFDRFTSVVRAVEEFWLKVVELPTS
jgi:CheY-like chemotaxis protein